MTLPTAEPDPQTADLLRRLRAWNVSSWRHGDRILLTRSALAALAALASANDGVPRPAVPDAGLQALADQLEVLCGDALGAGAPPGQVHAILGELGIELGLIRRS